MTIQLAFLDSGKTLALPAGPGARIRVLEGVAWVTTSGSFNDVWLNARQEHRVQTRGLTVIESAARSCVALIPPPNTAPWQTKRLVRLGRWLDGSLSVARGVGWCRGNVSKNAPLRIQIRGQTVNRYETSIPRVLFGIAAAAMTAITLGLFVILPAKVESDSQVQLQAASNAGMAKPIDVVMCDPRVTEAPASQTIMQASSIARSSTRIQ